MVPRSGGSSGLICLVNLKNKLPTTTPASHVLHLGTVTKFADVTASNMILESGHLAWIQDGTASGVPLAA
jgi:hypothetical protein